MKTCAFGDEGRTDTIVPLEIWCDLFYASHDANITHVWSNCIPNLGNRKRKQDMPDDFAARLRELRDRQGWTVAEMSYRTDIPKRTLDKYLLREGSSLPGFEALLALSKGLGVSLDWLVVGSEAVSETSELVVDKCASKAALPVFDALLRYHREAIRPIFEGELILGLAPEEWAAEIGSRAGEEAKSQVVSGMTKEDLLMWRQRRTDRMIELRHDRVQRITSPALKEDK